MREKTLRKKIEIVLVISIVGLGSGILAALPQERWSAAWGNFFGAAIVAIGGILGCLDHAKAAPNWVVTLSWSCIAVGGCVIAGASLQAALVLPS